MNFKNLVTTLIIMCWGVTSLFAIGEKTAHHDLAWLGFLKLPTEQVVPSNLLKLKKPLKLKNWQNEEHSHLSWLPVAKYERFGLVPKYYIKFNRSDKNKTLSRREKAKLR
jgi:hypothetical protein